MTELEKMQRAHLYIMKLANGIDPLSDEELPADATLNQVRLSRCFFYVGDVLRKVIENGGEVEVKKRSREPLQITEEQLREIQPSDTPLTVTHLCKLISAGAEGKLSYKTVTDWMHERGFLCTEIVHDKRRKRVSELGRQIGLFEERRQNEYGEYVSICYSREAQQFVIDNLPEMLG